MIVVALVGLSYMFFSGILTSTTEETEESIEKTTTSLLTQMKIETASESNIYIRNIGQSDVSNLFVYVDDEPVEVTVNPSIIKPGELGTVSVKDYIGKEDVNIRITTTQGGAFTEKKLENMIFCDDSDVLLCLKFDEGTGTKVYDHGPYGNNGTLYNATTSCYNNNCPTWVDGKYGKAVKFINNSQYNQSSNISHSKSLNFTSNDFTILSWFKPEIGDECLIALKHTSAWDYYWGLWASSSATLDFYITDPSTSLWLIHNEFPNNNLWQHVAVTKKGSTMKLYNNGTEVDEGFFTANADNLGSIFIGGENMPTYKWITNCTIDELIILNKSLTATEILEEFEK